MHVVTPRLLKGSRIQVVRVVSVIGPFNVAQLLTWNRTTAACDQAKDGSTLV